jgi:hypothetical protein
MWRARPVHTNDIDFQNLRAMFQRLKVACQGSIRSSRTTPGR